MTIEEQLAFFGYTHKRDDGSDADGRHSLYSKTGELVGRYDAHEVAAFLSDLFRHLSDESKEDRSIREFRKIMNMHAKLGAA